MPESTKTTSSATMAAIVQHRYGAPEQVLTRAQIARPAPGADEVLVRMRATSVNTPDWLAVQGTPRILRLQAGLRRPAAPVRGSDIAGIVAAVGTNVTDLRIGDEVFGSQWGTRSRPGTFAEYALAPADHLIPKPAELSFEEAGASVMSGITALRAVRDVGRAGPGRRILINGASGGVGTFAIQIAKSLGAHVTAVCSTRNIEFVQSLGADEVVDYTRDDYTRGAQRYDVILDNVMNHPPAANAAVLTPSGTFIPNSIGDAGGFLGGLPRIARAQLMGRGSADVRSVTCVPDRPNLRDLAALLASGDIAVIIERTYPLNEAAAAIAHMLGHRARGQIAVTIPSADEIF
ncbi:NAD(P)-dependent alcohol dehydrogenase [Nocardia aurantia]|uniref:Alcohol dehydrogenase n=1 Tax=Nocardia aurantia TaxID=2585199 RepID=A0A7K0DYD4_9NOCA|nr:NAD(P)-dependent alcohol dehydrogenase [Nocardia aurantia]MQY30816.1 alcohol dehydrogenase [Nocardia aurantia]